MRKYCDLYITTRKVLKGERNNSTSLYEYSWHIFSRDTGAFEEIQSSYENENEEDQTYVSREMAEQGAAEAIQDYYV